MTKKGPEPAVLLRTNIPSFTEERKHSWVYHSREYGSGKYRA